MLTVFFRILLFKATKGRPTKAEEQKPFIYIIILKMKKFTYTFVLLCFPPKSTHTRPSGQTLQMMRISVRNNSFWCSWHTIGVSEIYTSLIECLHTVKTMRIRFIFNWLLMKILSLTIYFLTCASHWQTNAWIKPSILCPAIADGILNKSNNFFAHVTDIL